MPPSLRNGLPIPLGPRKSKAEFRQALWDWLDGPFYRSVLMAVAVAAAVFAYKGMK